MEVVKGRFMVFWWGRGRIENLGGGRGDRRVDMEDTIATLFIHFGGNEGTTGCPRHIKVCYQLLEISANKSLGELQCDTDVVELFTMYGEGAKINIYVHDPFSIEGDSKSEYGTSGVEQPCLTSLGDNVLDLGNESSAEGAVDSHEEVGSDFDYVYGDSGNEGEGQNTSCLDDSSDDDDEPKVEKPIIKDIGVPHIDELKVTDNNDDQKSLADSDEDHKKLDEFTEFGIGAVAIGKGARMRTSSERRGGGGGGGGPMERTSAMGTNSGREAVLAWEEEEERLPWEGGKLAKDPMHKLHLLHNPPSTLLNGLELETSTQLAHRGLPLKECSMLLHYFLGSIK
ncbi:hypothetical protein RHSIM_Rhsim07G0155700 [Rhododendron simsii]|uniref:Uncharacterized protein n=1 Tax=Rhododendron simsii TaxID=118357 RepID=A0A834LIE4_RHOSS|nr:hypothetical protein RHSIM_Rhsim07G0155700 [Rhododendron simsii]